MFTIEVTIHLDTTFTSEEVWNYLIRDAFGEDFHPMYIWNFLESGNPNESEKLDNEVYASYLDTISKHDFSIEELNTSSHGLCGSFHVNSQDVNRHFMHFLLPKLGEEDGIPILKWEYLDPAIIVNVIRSTYKSDTTFYTTITMSPGLWGIRHNWLEGMLNVLEQQGEIAGTPVESLKTDIERDLQPIKEFEEGVLSALEIPDRIWTIARDIIERFAIDDTAVHVNPTIDTNAASPVDVETYVPSKLPSQPVSIPADIWTQLAWHETLSWSAPSIIRNRTVNYWIHHPSEEKFLEMIKPTHLGGKGTWPTIVEIITKRPETPVMIGELLTRIADPNWPGAGEAMHHLYYVVKERAIPVIDEFIQIAKDSGDDWWEEILVGLKAEILD